MTKKLLNETNRMREMMEFDKPKGTYFRSGDWEGYKFNSYQVRTEELDEILDTIDNLPNTIRELNVQNDLLPFDSGRVKVDLSDEEWREKVKRIVINISKSGEIATYHLNSYFGDSDTTTPYEEHPYYISYTTKE